MQPTRHPKIGIWKNIPTDSNKLRADVNELVRIARMGKHSEIVEKIKGLVPEYAGGENG
jgi:hypothetical protein